MLRHGTDDAMRRWYQAHAEFDLMLAPASNPSRGAAGKQRHEAEHEHSEGETNSSSLPPGGSLAGVW